MIKFTPSYWNVLSVMRFFLATIVCICHLRYFAPLTPGMWVISDLGGKAAVVCFLLISGLSVGYSFFNSDKGFIKRRLLRIYPLYFIAVTLAVILQWYIPTPFRTFDAIFIPAGVMTSIINYFFLQGIVSITITFNGPLWSLSVEIILYLLAPLLAKLSKNIIIMLAIVSIGCFYFFYGAELLFGWRLLIYAWAWLLGFLVAKTRKVDMFILLILLLGLAASAYHFFAEDRFSWITLIAGSLIIIAFPILYKSINKPRITSVTNFLGDISYPVYVFHWPLGILLYYLGVRDIYVMIACIFVISTIFYYIFDVYLKKVFWKPFFEYIFRFVPNRIKYLF